MRNNAISITKNANKYGVRSENAVTRKAKLEMLNDSVREDGVARITS